MLPEKYGADILFLSHLGLVGIQRKEIDDLVSSIQVGGRLQEQLAKMNQLDVKILLVEGDPSWTTDGVLQSRSHWTLAHHNGTLWSVQSMGFWVGQTKSMTQTCAWLKMLEVWLRKRHDSLLRRPKVKPTWGDRDNKDWSIGILSQLPGVSLKRAEAIFDKVGLPLVWDQRIPIDALLDIDGIGEKTVEGILKCLS